MCGHGLRFAIAGVLLVAGGCDVVFDLEVPATPDAASFDADLVPDALVAGTPFGTPALVVDLYTTGEDDDPSLTEDLLEFYLYSNGEIYRSTRASDTEAWAPIEPVTELNSPTTDFRPSVSADGRTIYFTRGPVGMRDILVSRRDSREAPWGPPVPVEGDVNTPGADEVGAWSSDDGTTLYFEAPGPGGDVDLFLATRTASGTFVRAPFVELNSLSNDRSAWGSRDGTSILFESDRGGDSSYAIWEAFRVGDEWQIVMRDELASSRFDGNPWLSPDGRTVVFSSNRLGSGAADDLYMATR